MARCISQLGCPEDKISIRRLGIQVEKIAFRPRICDSSRPLAVLIAGHFGKKGNSLCSGGAGAFPQRSARDGISRYAIRHGRLS